MADTLSTRRLHKLCSTVLGTGFLAGSTKLYEIERAAWACYQESPSGADRALCFAMGHLFERLAKRQDGEPVSPEEGVRLANLLNQPIRECTDYLVGAESVRDGLQILTVLVDAIHAAKLFGN
jgi:hypothetical protein